MSQPPLVSIIIPTYNRAHLIGETLDSVLAQTYPHWECLIIDDGSTDNSLEVIQTYIKQDNRMKLFTRPAHRLKGANACRNIGLENAVGEYIVFFDSDDLMTPDHLQVKVDGILQYACDYVITRTEFFNKEDYSSQKYYRFDVYKISPYNYVSQNINWLTCDILLKSNLAKSVKFNEILQSGQEYNYFIKIVTLSDSAFFINKIVSLRRYHEQSIQSQLKKDKIVYKRAIIVRWVSYHDIKNLADKETRRSLLQNIVEIILKEHKLHGLSLWKLQYYLIKEFGLRSSYFVLYLIFYTATKKGHFLRKKVLQLIQTDNN